MALSPQTPGPQINYMCNIKNDFLSFYSNFLLSFCVKSILLPNLLDYIYCKVKSRTNFLSTLDKDFFWGKFPESMEYICIPSQLGSGTSESGIPLCCEQCISSCGQEVAQSFLSRSFSSEHSSHKIQVQM